MDKDNKNMLLGVAIGSVSVGLMSILGTRKLPGSKKEICTIVKRAVQQRDQITKRILVCGSGMMTPSLVSYLMRNDHYSITIASNIINDARAIAGKYPGRADACFLDVGDEEQTINLVKDYDIVISYIPPFLHPKIFKACSLAKIHLVTASYLTDDMLKYDKECKKDDVIFLNECGLDPGIDIMSTMKIKDEIEAEGGKITKYESWCGGLPCAEDSDNPLSYKFSWEPKAVFSTSKNSATFLKDGKVVKVEAEDLMKGGTRPKNYSSALNLEGYPNRDSSVFKKAFNFKDAKTFIRGTLRYGGFSIIMRALHQIGITNADFQIDHRKIKTMRDLTKSLVKDVTPKVDDFTLEFENSYISDKEDQELISCLLQKVPDRENYVKIINSWKFFELFNGERKIKEEWKTALDALSAISLEKMSYAEGERDLIIMKHIFEIETSEGKKKLLHSTMIASGDRIGSSGFSAMAKTVGFTTAIGVNLILEGKIKARGVLSPKTPEFYEQMLPILEEDGIKVSEKYL